MNEFSYEKLVSRNYLFIDNVSQKTIKNTTLVFAGCGLSSVMIEMAARVGFEKFVLIDSDSVELSNLNRQNYQLSDLGSFKVDALEKKLMNINPDIQVSLIKDGIKNINDIESVISQGNIIINTIDC